MHPKVINILNCFYKMEKEVLTLREAAEYLGMKETTLRNMTQKKAIPHYKSKTNRTYFDIKELRAYALAVRVPLKEEILSKAETRSLA